MYYLRFAAGASVIGTALVLLASWAALRAGWQTTHVSDLPALGILAGVGVGISVTLDKWRASRGEGPGAQSYLSQLIWQIGGYFAIWYGGWALLWSYEKVSRAPSEGWWDSAILAGAVLTLLNSANNEIDRIEIASGREVVGYPYLRSMAFGILLGTFMLVIAVRTGLMPLEPLAGFSRIVIVCTFISAGILASASSCAGRRNETWFAHIYDLVNGALGGLIASFVTMAVWNRLTDDTIYWGWLGFWLVVGSVLGVVINLRRKGRPLPGVFRIGLSGIIAGGAEVAVRGKVLVIGLFFGAIGLALLWYFLPALLHSLGDQSASPGILIFVAAGTAIGGYFLFARGLEPIRSALNWSPLRGDTHGASRTATERELRRARLIPRNDNIYLGEFLKAGRPRPQVGYPGPAHLITIGPNRCGKGVGLIVPNLVDLKRSILMIDPKGEAAAITARHRAKLGRVVVLNPFRLFVDERPWLESEGFNPLVGLDPNSKYFVDDATGIGEALVRIEEGRERHWSASAQDLVGALVMFECLKARASGRPPSLVNVRTMLTEPYGTNDGMPTGMALTVAEMLQSGFRPLVQKVGRLKEQSREINSIISVGITQTVFLDSPPVAEDLERGSFDFADMKREIVTVYLIPPAQHISKHANWLRLIVQSALQALQNTPSSTLPPPLFLMDEFAQLGHLQSIQDGMGMLAGFGVQLWPILQDLNQLHTQYKDAWQSFIGQKGALTAFAPKDMFTAEHLAKLCGQKTEIIQTENERADQSGHGRSWGPQGLPLFRPEDLMRMPRGQMLCLVEGVDYPFFTLAPPYWTTTAFNPPTLDDNPYAPKSK